MNLKYEFRCGAPIGRGRHCFKLLGTAEDEGSGLIFSGGYLYPNDEVKNVYRLRCPVHGEGVIAEPRFLWKREPRRKPYVELAIREP